MPTNDFVRVEDKDTGHKLTVRESAVPHGNYKVLKDVAVDLGGDPLPVEYATPEPLSSPTTSGQSADMKKEKADG